MEPTQVDYQGKDQYQDIAKEYKQSKLLPFRTESETPTFMKLLGSDLGDQSVCDFACGEGFYTRQLREITTGKVVGVDISENMIKLAQSQEAHVPRVTKVDYRCADACAVESDFQKEFSASFDVVTATFLLNYADKREMIRGFLSSAFKLLKPGGRFIGINTSPFVLDQISFDKTKKYRVAYTIDQSPIKEGDPLHIHISMEDGDAKFDNYFWTAETYEVEFEKAGFAEMQWIKMTLADGNDPEFWKDWLKNCPLICFSATKPLVDGES